jgi:hypothetical protein
MTGIGSATPAAVELDASTALVAGVSFQLTAFALINGCDISHANPSDYRVGLGIDNPARNRHIQSMTKLIFAAALCWMRRTGNAPDLAARRVVSKQRFFSVCLALAGIASAASTEGQTARESVQVPGNGGAVTFTNSFDRGELFLLKAAGAVVLGQDLLDAEYQSASATAPGMDVVSGTDVGIDIGLKAPRAPKGVLPGRMKWFGSYRADHTYYLLATGTGQPLTLRLVTGGNRIGSGTITVSLFRLSPPAELATPLETKQVSFLEETVQTTLTTSNPVDYLLQASGDGKVGGGGLGRGDAEYMDYKADGSGNQDIGDRNIDYGLGVDEADTSKTPRQNWWGPWRLDHNYFMLFAGTGQPIHFHYYDSVYSDNSPTDRLTVKVFPVP